MAHAGLFLAAAAARAGANPHDHLLRDANKTL
jgi:hypothetical protein